MFTGAPGTEQRGEPRQGHVDIGVFQSQGFLLTPVLDRTPESTVARHRFTNALGVTVTPVNKLEPVDGGVVSFAAPMAGASATTSAATAVITNLSGEGQASVIASANNTPGAYIASARPPGPDRPTSP